MDKTIALLKKFPIIFFIFLCVSVWSLAASADSNLAEWQTKYKENPNSVLNIFNLGVSYQKEQKYKAAIKYYRKALKKETKLKPLIKYYLAKAYVSINDKRRAKKVVASVDIDKLPTNFKKRILEFKNNLYADEVLTPTADKATQVAAQRFNGNLRLGYGYNSNPQFISGDDTSAAIDEDQQFNANLNIYYQPLRGDSYDLGLDFRAFNQSYSTNGDSDFNYGTLSLPFNLFTANYRYQIGVSKTYQGFSGSAFSNIWSGFAEIKRKLSSSYMSLGLSYDSIDIDNDDYYYLSGQTLSPYLQWQRVWVLTQLSVRYQFDDNNFQDSSVVSPSFEAHTLSTYISQSISSWAWSLTLAYQMRKYAFDVTESDTRKDNRYWINAVLNYYFYSSFSIFIDLYYINNDSNFDQNTSDDKNFNQFSAISGINWNF